MRLTRILAQEIAETIKRPSRLLNAASPRRVAAYLEFQRLRFMAAGPWAQRDEAELATREVGSYED
jgi:hypothetical protein